MGKKRTRLLGIQEVEEKQKEDQKKRAMEKKIKEGKKKQETEEQKKSEHDKKSKKEVKKENTQAKQKRGKKYMHALSQIEKGKKIKLAEAIALLKKIHYVSFDESVELHINVDKTGLRGEIELPHSIGKTVRVAIVDDSLLEKLAEGKIEFDVLITHPSFMPKLSKYAKILGPRGLMPNPKAGTISPKPEEVAKKFEKGMIRWKTEPKFPIIHQMIGKLSHEQDKLVENAHMFLKAIGKVHIKSVYITSTMSPSIVIDIDAY